MVDREAGGKVLRPRGPVGAIPPTVCFLWWCSRRGVRGGKLSTLLLARFALKTLVKLCSKITKMLRYPNEQYGNHFLSPCFTFKHVQCSLYTDVRLYLICTRRSAIDPGGSFGEASQTKNISNVLRFVPEVPFCVCVCVCENSVICLKSAIISSLYISYLLKIVFSTGFYDNISLIVPKSVDSCWKF